MNSTVDVLLVVTVAFLVIGISKMLLMKQYKNMPPGPASLPVLGSLHLLAGQYPHRSLANLASKHGPLMTLQLGQRLAIVASSPDTAREFLKVQDLNFASRPHNRFFSIVIPQDLVFNNITPPFRHLRKIFVTELTSAHRLQATAHIRAEEVAFMLREISEKTGPITVKNHVHVVGANIITRMVLNRRFFGTENSDNVHSDVHEFLYIASEIFKALATLDPKDFFSLPQWFDPQGLDARFLSLKARMDSFFDNMLRQHLELRRVDPIRDDEKTMLDVLLDQLGKNDQAENEVTEEHIKAMVWDAFLAGSETTSIAVEWAMAEVLHNPSILQEAQSELVRVVGSSRMVQESDLASLKYLQAIQKETLRLHSPIPMLVMHKSMAACKAFGFDIPATTRLIVNHWAIARDPNIWQNPLEFMPERFLPGGQHVNTDFLGKHFEYTPFGSGRRMCPGLALGATSMQLQLANLLHAFDWEVSANQIDLTEQCYHVSAIMGTPLVAVAIPRLPSSALVPSYSICTHRS